MALRQEQEPAQAEVTEVGPGILRMQLPVRIPGLGHVNCYALIDGEGVALVDPGLPDPWTWRALQDRLAQADVKLKHVHTVIVTHSHPDHFGGAVRLHKETGARVLAHRSFSFGAVNAEEPEVSVDDLTAQMDSDAAEEGAEPQVTRADRARTDAGRTPWGAKPRWESWPRRMMWRAIGLLTGSSFVPRINQRVRHGEVLKLAGRDFFVLHTPGHTSDHICFHDPETETLLAGDHVLPTITPHISGIAESRDPLASFFESLDQVAALPNVQNVLPAHGHPFEDLAARTVAIKHHHQERLDRIKKISRELGPSSVEQISRRLFRRKAWGSMAESETYAHLEHMRIAGEADRHQDADGKLIYST